MQSKTNSTKLVVDIGRLPLTPVLGVAIPFTLSFRRHQVLIRRIELKERVADESVNKVFEAPFLERSHVVLGHISQVAIGASGPDGCRRR